MSVWKKTLVYLGLVDQDELFDEEEEAGYEDVEPETPATIRKLSREELTTVHALPSRPLGQVHIVEPRVYDDAQEIGDKLKDSIPVIMNVSGVEEDLRKRLTAFCAGLAYGLGGRVQKLAHHLYLVTPANVEVSAEDRKRLAERALFDEF